MVVANASQANADGDGTGDACDECTDTDADGFGDPGFPASTCAPDDCPAAADASQANADGDALGDACDACPNDARNDEDGDGVCRNVDNCPVAANAGQADVDGDGVGDACDDCRLTPDGAQEDADADGRGDACDFAWGDEAPSDAPDQRVDAADLQRLRDAVLGRVVLPAAESLHGDVAPAVLAAGTPPVAAPSPGHPARLSVADLQLVSRAVAATLRFVVPE